MSDDVGTSFILSKGKSLDVNICLKNFEILNKKFLVIRCFLYSLKSFVVLTWPYDSSRKAPMALKTISESRLWYVKLRRFTCIQRGVENNKKISLKEEEILRNASQAISELVNNFKKEIKSLYLQRILRSNAKFRNQSSTEVLTLNRSYLRN